MSAAWRGGVLYAESFVQSSKLLEAVSNAMDWWFLNDFTNEACLDSGGTPSCPRGTPGMWNTNWYSNVSIALRLNDVHLLVYF